MESDRQDRVTAARRPEHRPADEHARNGRTVPFDLEVAGSVRAATREALASTSGVESITVLAGSLVLHIADQSALVAVILKAHTLGLTIAGVVAAPRA